MKTLSKLINKTVLTKHVMFKASKTMSALNRKAATLMSSPKRA